MEAREDLQRELATRARALLSKGKARKAEYLFWEILQEDPSAPISTFLLGVSILMQARHRDARRLIERAYRLRPSVRDEFRHPDRVQRLREAAEVAPDWTWPRYQLSRDRWGATGLTLPAAVAHASRAGRPARTLETLDVRSPSAILYVDYRAQSIDERLDACGRLDAAGFAWVFEDAHLLAVRRESFAEAFALVDRLAVQEVQR